MSKTSKQLLAHHEPVELPSNLSEFAAHAAAKELAQNWEAALRDGVRLPRLLEDVDTVCALLQAWKMQIAR